MHVDRKNVHLAPQYRDLRLSSDISSPHGLRPRVADSSQSRQGFLSNFYHVIEFYDVDESEEEEEFSITKTCLYTFDPLKPHFYIVKLRFTGVYIIFLISAQKHRLWVFVRTALQRRF